MYAKVAWERVAKFVKICSYSNEALFKGVLIGSLCIWSRGVQ